jgi:nitroreductase
MSWLDPDVFTEAVTAATRAPSMHNSQPWRFRLAGDAVDLLLDPDRRLPVADAGGWAAHLGCGAALFNLRLALVVRHRPATVRLFPDPAQPDLLARLTSAAPRPATPAEQRLHRAIAHRHTNRMPFRDDPVPPQARTALVAAARAEQCRLDLLDTATLDTTAKLIRAADELLNRDADYRAELAAWTRYDEPVVDGVPAKAGGPAPRPDELLARRDFGGADMAAHRGFERDPLVAVLSAAGDAPADQVQAGQALEAVLLTATELSLAVSMFSQPVEVPSVREELRQVLGRPAPPQMLLRIGYAIPAAATPRRPVADVIADVIIDETTPGAAG